MRFTLTVTKSFGVMVPAYLAYDSWRSHVSSVSDVYVPDPNTSPSPWLPIDQKYQYSIPDLNYGWLMIYMRASDPSSVTPGYPEVINIGAVPMSKISDGGNYQFSLKDLTLIPSGTQATLKVTLTNVAHLPISGIIKPILQKNGELEQKEFNISALGSQVIRFPATITIGLPREDPVTLLINGVSTNLGLVS